jgi:hypothetical protein
MYGGGNHASMPPEHRCFEFLIGSLLRFTQNRAEAIVADRKVLKCVQNPQESLKSLNLRPEELS